MPLPSRVSNFRRAQRRGAELFHFILKTKTEPIPCSCTGGVAFLFVFVGLFVCFLLAEFFDSSDSSRFFIRSLILPLFLWDSHTKFFSFLDLEEKQSFRSIKRERSVGSPVDPAKKILIFFLCLVVWCFFLFLLFFFCCCCCCCLVVCFMSRQTMDGLVLWRFFVFFFFFLLFFFCFV